ncbi:putative bifunctional diguanylate cyclase/phosphodiesterase [Rubellimicrobium aerolatum]|uniref:Bifunctional diguanylate cyclase/phosphodiesterase n=1 Tax=Rubellimicrobium aerolatum TaxID=490979 RepID=A0ABW0SH40_9RHOB|nr:EAL domain-containing protein [Rubellimicrobium aerolatum]MBP1805846.1 diguanylate cyclase (GGDEF)-like protein [Rubellimicrobium aerolatum]
MPRLHRLPARIAAVMVGTILVLVLTVSGSVLWMTRALDDQARRQAEARILDARDGMVERARLLALDYAKWEDTATHVTAGDTDWMRDKIGATAIAGEAFQIAMLWGGPLERDLGWTIGGPAEPREGLLDPLLLGLAESRLALVPLDTYDGTEFFAWSAGHLYVLAAARVEHLTERGGGVLPDDRLGRLVMGQRIGAATVGAMRDDLLLSEVALVRRPPQDRPSLPLLDAQGAPVAFISWEPPHPGSDLLRRMLPLLVVVMALTAGLVAVGMTLVRRSADHLIAAERRSALAARTDPLTGLMNRTAFNEALATPAREGERAILYLDVDGFKRINDAIGHAAGDSVIAHLGERLSDLAGPGCLLARVGGDEFVFILDGPDAGARARDLAAAVGAALRSPLEVPGHRLRIGASVGYAVQGKAGSTAEDLVRHADLAMYEAKRHRDRGPVAFGDMIETADREARIMERALREALDRPGELSLVYQPIRDPRTGRLAKAEALARWTSPQLGPVRPDRFIAVAEQSGLIVDLGWRLFLLLCDDLERHADLVACFNVSPLQLLAPTFVPDLIGELGRRGIDPRRLEVELTERVLVDDPRLAAERLEELRAAGFPIALDDFGTGYSSIGYLRQMGFDTLKIDRSYVADLHDRIERQALLNAMIELAHALGLEVVCEGVEAEDDLRIVRELGCDLAQGYHLGRPMALGDLMAPCQGPARSVA